MHTLIALAATAVAVSTLLVAALWRVLRLPDDNPRAVRGRARGGRTVAFVGASIIHGRVSAPLPPRVVARVGDGELAVVNGGVNGDLAWNALQRVGDVVACDPDEVIVLVGSNDVMGSLDPRAARRYRVGKKLPQDPDIEFFRGSLDALIAQLARDARVALCTLPPIGEDLASSVNVQVRRYNEVVRDVAAARGAVLLDVYATVGGALPARAGRAALLGAPLVLPMLLRGGLGLSFSRIGRLFGFALLSDGVHLTEPAADLVADLMAGFLHRSARGQ